MGKGWRWGREEKGGKGRVEEEKMVGREGSRVDARILGI